MKHVGILNKSQTKTNSVIHQHKYNLINSCIFIYGGRKLNLVVGLRAGSLTIIMIIHTIK